MKENENDEKVNKTNINFHQNDSQLDRIDNLLKKYHIDLKKYTSLIEPSNSYNRENIIKRGELFDLSCPICLDLLNNPICCSLKENSHSFCKECIDCYLKNNSTCPICKCNFEYKTKEDVQKMLNKLLFRCIYFKDGCKKVISYSEYLKHIKECENKNKNPLYECLVEKYNYENICFEECKFSGNMKEIKEHFKNCAFSKIKCFFCKYDVLSINLKYHMEKYCKLKIVNYENGEKYVGEMKNNKREGFGIFYYLNNVRYEGEWKNDKREGYGIIFLSNGSRYECEWKNNKINGIGICYFSDEGKYEGEFKDDELYGYGTLLNQIGKYEGQFKNGILNGYGILKSKNGDLYQGHWKNFSYDGYGLFIHTTGIKYEGFWKNNIKDGFGILSNLELSYKGQWKDDNMHGYGILSDSSKDVLFQGEWKNNAREGYGISYSKGKIFKGYYKNNKVDGYGVLYLNNDIKCEGEFKEDYIDDFYLIAENMKELSYKENFKNNMKEGIENINSNVILESKVGRNIKLKILHYLNKSFILLFNKGNENLFFILDIN